MTDPAARLHLRKNLRSSIIDGACFSTMVGLGETYFSAFVLAVSGSQVASGLVTTIPFLSGSILQLVSPRAVDAMNSHRRWVMTCVVTQSLSFLPLMAAALAGHVPTAVVFLLAAVYWGGGMAAGSAWNTWMGRITLPRLRAGFFGFRTRVMQACTLLGVVAGGSALEWGKAAGYPVTIFAGLFFAAWLMRFISSRMLARMTEPPLTDDDHRVVPIRDVLSKFVGRDGRLFVYLLAVQFGQQVAAPYFNPFLLKHLAFSYWEYTMLLAAAFIGRSASSAMWGQYARRFGTRSLLIVGGVGIIPLAALWMASPSFWYLFGLQFFAGAAWAAFDLANFLLYFETIDAEERTSVLTAFNLFNGISYVSGSLLGGLLLRSFGEGQAAYEIVFGLSTLVRLATLSLLLRLPKYRMTSVPIATDPLAVRPSAGSIVRPDFVSLPDKATSGLITDESPGR